MSDFRGPRGILAQSLQLGVLLAGICSASVKMSSLTRNQEDYVLFCPDPKIKNETLLIKWYFQSKNLCLLTIWSGESHPRWIIPQEEYKNRLSTPYGESLKITNLTPADSGYYEAHIQSVSGKIYIEKFNLTVFGPVTTESTTESNRNSLILLWLAGCLVLVLVMLLAVWYSPHKVKSRLCKILGIFTRENIQHTTLGHERLEEGLTACPNGFHSDQETN